MTDTMAERIDAEAAPQEAGAAPPAALSAQERQRAAYTDMLRDLAAHLGAHPVILPEPYRIGGREVHFNFLHGDDPRGALAAAARTFAPCTWEKRTRDYKEGGTSYFEMSAEWHGWRIEMTAFRDAVCKRVVTGTREVTETVKDPDRLAEVPEVEVTRTEEIIEWVCEPVMAPAGEGPVAA